jgi:hypothetical protein
MLSLASGIAACSGSGHPKSLPTPLPPSPSADPSATETPFAIVIDKSRPLLLSRTGMNGAAFDVRLVSDAMLTVSFLCEGTGTGSVSVDDAGNTVRCGGRALTSEFQVRRPVAHLRIQAPGRWQLAVQQDR